VTSLEGDRTFAIKQSSEVGRFGSRHTIRFHVSRRKSGQATTPFQPAIVSHAKATPAVSRFSAVTKLACCHVLVIRRRGGVPLARRRFFR
jgi:hypothetical protein